MSGAKHDGINRRNFIRVSTLLATATWLGVADSHLQAKVKSKAPKGEYDLLVIGAGLGGLTCAGYAAKQGLKVAVIEQHDIPGGYATTFTRGDPELTFDVSLHQIVLHGPAKQIMEDLGVLEKTKFHKCNELFRYRSNDIDIAVPAAGPDVFKNTLKKRFPKETKGIDGFTSDMIEIHNELGRLFSKGGPSFIDKIAFPIKYPALWASRKKTLEDYLNDHVRNPELRSVLSAFSPYYGLPPSQVSGFYYLNATAAYVIYGGSYPEGGSQSISDAITDAIKSNGGIFKFNTKVNRVLVKDGKALGVLTSDGETIKANAIVANCSAENLYGKMIDQENLPSKYRKRVKKLAPSVSSFIVWLGLHRDITDSMRDSHIFLMENMDQEESFTAALEANAHKAPLGVCVYDNIYRDYSPKGSTVLSIIFTSGYGPWKEYEAEYWAGKKHRYNEKKEEISKIMIQRVEKALIPNLASMINVKEASTPLTNIRYTLNSSGAIYGYEQVLENSFMNRISNRTPIKGLYLASAWGEPGGGYPAVLISGKKTFGMLMDDWEQF